MQAVVVDSVGDGTSDANKDGEVPSGKLGTSAAWTQGSDVAQCQQQFIAHTNCMRSEVLIAFSVEPFITRRMHPAPVS
eukprot:1159364-Pelagomonas_calceolata.AAC.6